MLRFILASVITLLLTFTALGAGILPADHAEKSASENSVFLIDIRRPSEWKESGVASSAHPISMHDDGFLQNLEKLVSGQKDAPIALICATGGRSAWLATQLEKRGYSNISDVSEGMFGSRAGPGWIARGLPMTKIK